MNEMTLAAIKDAFPDFDWWIAGERAKAWEEGHLAGYRDAYDHRYGIPENPYREGEQPETYKEFCERVHVN